MEIVISQAYRDSLVPLPEDILKDMNIPEEPHRFLTETGLPFHTRYEITPNAPITFFDKPYIKKHAHFQNTFLYFASMDVMGLVAMDVKNLAVFQMQIGKRDRWGEVQEIPVLMNDGIRQFVDCLGLWLSFYPQLRAEAAQRLEVDPNFSLFDHEELYKPILAKLKEADPFAMRQRNFFWRRICQPDIL